MGINLTKPTKCTRIIEMGEIRKLTSEEKTICNKTVNYVWVVTKPYICQWGEYNIIVPTGFLSDGSTGAPDKGISWLFHDYLYATHQFCQEVSCSESEANTVMSDLLLIEKRWFYNISYSLAVYVNPFRGFSSAWQSSYQRGPEFLPNSKQSIITILE